MNPRERQLPPLPVLLRRVLPVALAVGLLCAVVAGLVSGQRPAQYSATSLVLLRPVAPDPALGGTTVTTDFTEGEGLATNVLLVSRPGVLERVAERPQVQLTPAQIDTGLEVEGVEGTNVIRVSFTSGDPATAARVATAVGEEYVEIRRTAARTRARQAREIFSEQLDALGDEEDGTTESALRLREEVERLRVVEQLEAQAPQVVEEAAIPSQPVSPQPLRDAGLAGLLGLVVGTGLGLLRVGTDRRLGGSDELRKAFAAPVLVTVPPWRSLRRNRRRQTTGRREVQGFQLLHLSLRGGNGRAPVRTVAITGPGPDDDADVAAWHLAAAASAARDRVLLVEGGGTRGDGGALADRIRQVSPRNGHGAAPFDVLETDGASGSEEDTDADPQTGFEDLLREADEVYDVVVVPTPSVAGNPDAAPVLQHVDGVVVTARRGRLGREQVEALRSQLELLGTTVLAVVVDGG